MGETSISWTERSWNPIIGCSVVSPGCKHCYAMAMAARIQRMTPDSHYEGTTQPSKAGPVWTGKMVLAPDHILTEPLRRRKPTTWFVNSMSDLFHEAVPDAWIDRVFAVMALAPQHTFQVLTKRPARMRAYMTARNVDFPTALASAWGHVRSGIPASLEKQTLLGAWPDGGACLGRDLQWPLPNVWLGVSTEDQRRADERVPDLLATPAAVRFVSAEPLLARIDFSRSLWVGAEGGSDFAGSRSQLLDWIIVGGESGPHARPMHPQWARDIRDQCAAAGVPYHHKQNGEWAFERPQAGGDLGGDVRAGRVRIVHAAEHTDAELCRQSFYRGDIYMRRVGKARAGRLLDGVEHNGMPTTRAEPSHE